MNPKKQATKINVIRTKILNISIEGGLNTIVAADSNGFVARGGVFGWLPCWLNHEMIITLRLGGAKRHFIIQ